VEQLLHRVPRQQVVVVAVDHGQGATPPDPAGEPGQLVPGQGQWDVASGLVGPVVPQLSAQPKHGHWVRGLHLSAGRESEVSLADPGQPTDGADPVVP